MRTGTSIASSRASVACFRFQTGNFKRLANEHNVKLLLISLPRLTQHPRYLLESVRLPPTPDGRREQLAQCVRSADSALSSSPSAQPALAVAVQVCCRFQVRISNSKPALYSEVEHHRMSSQARFTFQRSNPNVHQASPAADPPCTFVHRQCRQYLIRTLPPPLPTTIASCIATPDPDVYLLRPMVARIRIPESPRPFATTLPNGNARLSVSTASAANLDDTTAILSLSRPDCVDGNTKSAGLPLMAAVAVTPSSKPVLYRFRPQVRSIPTPNPSPDRPGHNSRRCHGHDVSHTAA